MEENRNLFNIPAYIKVGNKRFKVIKWGVTGAVIENSPIVELKETVTANFIFPYDTYNELIIPDVKLKCYSENGTLFCKFENLSKDQENLFKFLIREYLWRRIISIPSEFMNYTQDNEIRKELLTFQRNLTLKRKLKKIMYLMVVVVTAGTIFLGAKIFFYTKNTGLTVKYSEANGKKTRREVELFAKEKEVKQKREVKTSQEPPQPKVEVSTEKELNERAGKGSSQQLAANRSSTPSQGVVTANKKAEENKKLPEESSEKTQVSSIQKREKLLRGVNYYCVQVATDSSPERLIKLAEKLNEFPYVRVEKIGKFFTLRVGFDRSLSKDKKLAKEIREKINKKAFSRICVYKPERWVYPQTEAK